VAVVAREGQRSRLVCGYAVARKRVTRLLQFLSKTKGKGGIFVKDDPAALVILDEGGSELADGHRREPSGLRGLQHCGHQGETSLICIAHGFDHTEILDECRRRKVDLGSLRVPSFRRRRIHHVAVKSVCAWIDAGGDGS